MSASTGVTAPPLPIGEKAVSKPKKQPYPFWLGGMCSIASFFDYSGSVNDATLSFARCRCDNRRIDNAVSHSQSLSQPISNAPSSLWRSPLDLTKVRLQASGDKRMIASIQKTVHTAGEFWSLAP